MLLYETEKKYLIQINIFLHNSDKVCITLGLTYFIQTLF